MKITKNVELIDLVVYLSEHNTLVLSDIHMGYEASLKGVMLPRMQLEDTVKRLDENVFSVLKKEGKAIEQIVITGDLKHEFGRISEQEWRNVLKFVDFLKKQCEHLILIKGNHDTMLNPILQKRGIEYVDEVILDDVLICHGDVIKEIESKQKITTIIIGHEHCALGLRRGNRVEKFKCFLVGAFEKKQLIAMPSLNLLTVGTDVLSDKLLSPYLQGDIDNFDAYLVDEKEILHFGTIKDIKGISSK